MKSNRFDFLELADQVEAPPIDAATKEQAPPEIAPASGPSQSVVPPKRTEPVRLAEVREDPKSRYENESDPTVPNPWERQAASARGLRAVEMFGQRGDKAGDFHYPTGLAVDRVGILWIADSQNHRLQRVTSDGGVAIVGSRGMGRGQFMIPMAVAVDKDRSFYVIEQGGHRFQKFTSEGQLEMVVGRAGSKPGEFRAPMGIAVNSDSGDIYVSDTGNSRVQRFDSAGQFQGIMGLIGGFAAPLGAPQGIAVDPVGRVYVTDTLAGRIVQYDPLGRVVGYYGGQLGPIVRRGSINMRLEEPHAIAFNDLGRMFVTDGQRSAGRIHVIETDTGAIDLVIDKPGKTLGLLARPSGIAVTPPHLGTSSNGDIYVADTMNHRIIRFAWQ